MKKSLILLGMLSIGYAYAQTGRDHSQHSSAEKRVGINTDKPVATLEISKVTGVPSTQTQGFLLPHLSQEERNAMDKKALTNGVMIFNTTKNCVDWWDGVKWACTDGTQTDLHTLPTPPEQGTAQVWDRTHYIASFTHNGANINGEINNTDKKLIIEIPYNEATGSYNSIEVLSANVAGRNGSKDLVLSIPAGQFDASKKGYLQAEIVVGNGTTDTYEVKHLAANAEEEIATFSFAINGRNSTVRLIASGGVLDKNWDRMVEGQYRHRFIYVPVSLYKFVTPEDSAEKYLIPNSGAPYEKVWLNNSLGAGYANVNSAVFNPVQQAKTPTDHNAYGSLFQWGRDYPGHELMNWTSSTTGTPVFTQEPYNWKTEGPKEVRPFYNPCPNGWTMLDAYEIPYYTYLDKRGIGISATLLEGVKLTDSGYRTKEDGAILEDMGKIKDWEAGSYGDRVGYYWTSRRQEPGRDSEYYMHTYGRATGIPCSYRERKDNGWVEYYNFPDCQGYRHHSFGLAVRCVKE